MCSDIALGRLGRVSENYAPKKIFSKIWYRTMFFITADTVAIPKFSDDFRGRYGHFHLFSTEFGAPN